MIIDKKAINLKSSDTIFKLKVLAKEKESIRRKLEITAKVLRFKAKQLAKIAKEKESVRRRLEATIKKLSLKTDELARTIIKEKAILDSIGDAVLACDKMGVVILFNRKAAILTGFSAKEVIGKHYNSFIKFISGDDGTPSKDFIAKALKTGYKTTMADNTLLVRKNGFRVPVADSAEPIRYNRGVLIGCVIVFRDITKEKAIDKAKSEFISVASHQLKTPATIVSLYTERLLDGKSGVITEKQKEYIEEIRGANQRMNDIVNTLLNVSRIEMGIFSVNPLPIDVVYIMKNVVKDARSSFEGKNIILTQEYHQPKYVMAIDKLLLNIVFSNLISNSIRYTSFGGKIFVKSQVAMENKKIGGRIIRENSLLVSVSNSSFGIPKAQHDKIFTKFFRSDNARSSQTDGTGLGLYIVKSILDHIGGQVWFLSEEDKETIFYFTIPLVKMTNQSL